MLPVVKPPLFDQSRSFRNIIITVLVVLFKLISHPPPSLRGRCGGAASHPPWPGSTGTCRTGAKLQDPPPPLQSPSWDVFGVQQQQCAAARVKTALRAVSPLDRSTSKLTRLWSTTWRWWRKTDTKWENEMRNVIRNRSNRGNPLLRKSSGLPQPYLVNYLIGKIEKE